MTPFRERNQAVVGGVGLVVVLLLVLVAFNAEKLPFIGGGTPLAAQFTDASGLQPGNEVRVAGVKVGKVSAIGLERTCTQTIAGTRQQGCVRVDFQVDKGTELGNAPQATIRIKTVLGQKYLSLTPKGPGTLKKHAEIPLKDTATPFDVVQAFDGVASTVGDINTKQLSQAFVTIAQTFQNSPADVKSSLRGLSRLSTTISSRDAQLAALLKSADGVTGVLAARDKELVKLISDGDLLLKEVQYRRDAIHELLVSTAALSQQLSGLINDTSKTLKPALDQLGGVLTILKANQGNLDKSIGLLSPFVQVFANVLGNGHWFDTYICGLSNLAVGGLPSLGASSPSTSTTGAAASCPNQGPAK